MRMKTIKQKAQGEKQLPNIYMQKTQGPKPSTTFSNADQRLKSHTLLNKQNFQPNLQKIQTQRNKQTSFGAAKQMFRQSFDDLRAYTKNSTQNQYFGNQDRKQINQSNGNRNNLFSKSINFDQYKQDKPFLKKHLKTEAECLDNEPIYPIIKDCQMTKSQYGSQSDYSNQQQKLNFAKCVQRVNHELNNKISNNKNILIHESLDFDDRKDAYTFGPNQAKHLKKYQLTREQQRKMKNQIFDNIIENTKAQMMRSCEVSPKVACFNHTNKKAKYRLNATLTDDEDQSYYCSKCAVNLARQGFDIEQMTQIDRKMAFSKRQQSKQIYNSVQIKKQQTHRQQQFISFQKRLQLLKNKISAKLKQFSQKSEQMTKMDKKIQLTVSNYNSLIQILKKMRQDQIQKQEKHRKQKSLDINLKKHELSAILDNIKHTSFQITNQKNKLMALKNKQFTFMFDSYINKIASYQTYLSHLEQTQLSMDIANFDENIDCQDIDEDTVINLIFQQMYKRWTNPKLQAINCQVKPINQTKNQLKKLPKKRRYQEQGLQSGGTSMFYCEQQEQERKDPFRRLFEDSRAEDSMMTMIDDRNVGSTVANNKIANHEKTMKNQNRNLKQHTHQNLKQHTLQNLKNLKQQHPKINRYY